MTDLIERIKADRAAGTPGPWEWYNDVTYFIAAWFIPGVIIAAETDGTPGGDKMGQANARRIARVPEMEQALIDQSAEVNRLRDALECMVVVFDTPISRRLIRSEYATEARKIARAALQEDKTDG